MDRDKIEEMFRHGKYQKLIYELVSLGEDALDEFSLLRLAQTYLVTGDETNALKIIRKSQKRFAADSQYADEEERLSNAIIKGTTEKYIHHMTYREAAGGDKSVKQAGDIDRFFEGVVGMKVARKQLQEMDGAYSLQQERIKEGLENPVVWTPHVAVIGERGSGKTMLSRIITRFWYEKGFSTKPEPLVVMAKFLQTGKDVWQLAEKSDAVTVVENIEDLIFDHNVYQEYVLNAFVDVLRGQDDRKVQYIFTGSYEAVEAMKNINKDIEDCFYDFIELGQYTAEELIDIMKKIAHRDGFHIHKSCDHSLFQLLDMERKVSGFMNAVQLERFIRKASRNMVRRYTETVSAGEGINMEGMTMLLPEDFETNTDGKSVDQLCAELYGMTGLYRVKEEIKKQVTAVRIGLKAKTEGASRNNEHGTLHMVFAGEPGTGKTTVAEIVGRIYYALGILPKGNQKIHVVSRAELIAQYVGHTAVLVKETCRKADGGVLFIDEAYSLVNSEADTFGREAVDTLIQEMENRRDSMMVIMAGYEKQMDAFMNANPGFRSRVPNIIHFDSYTTDEMVEIFEHMVKGENYYFASWKVIEAVRGLIENKSREPDFGNARGVRNLFDKVKYAQDERLAKELSEGKQLLRDDYDAIKTEDIQETGTILAKGTKSIEELFEELRRLTGLDGVKRQVEDMVNSVKYEKLMKSKGIHNGRGQGTRHLVFSGNPGTGKSTVASLLGQIYVKLGILKKNTFVLAKRTDLVGEYLGQTAPRVANKVAEADGGILFIDEAYQLYTGDTDSYGLEAVGTLLSLAEEKRDTLMIILAGYSRDMNEFMNINPGLRSRFPTVIQFEDYTIDELMDIFVGMCGKESIRIGDDVMEAVREEIGRRSKKNNREFANARGVRNLLEQIILRQNSRIIQELDRGIGHSDEELLTIKKEDVYFEQGV